MAAEVGDAPVIVSACLAGIPCRYDGVARPDPEVVAAVERAEELGATRAVLKGKRPSCGSSDIYDGTFTGTLRQVTACSPQP